MSDRPAPLAIIQNKHNRFHVAVHISVYMYMYMYIHNLHNLSNSMESIPCCSIQAFQCRSIVQAQMGEWQAIPPNQPSLPECGEKSKVTRRLKLRSVWDRCGVPSVCLIVSMVRWGIEWRASPPPPLTQWHLQTTDIDQNRSKHCTTHWSAFRAHPRSWICFAYWTSMKWVQYQTL